MSTADKILIETLQLILKTWADPMLNVSPKIIEKLAKLIEELTKKGALLLALAILTSACGAAKYIHKPEYKTDTNQAEISHDPDPIATPAAAQTEEYASYAATAADMPDCKSANQNALIYVNDLQAFKVCQVGGWVDVKIQGKDGKNGADAPDQLNEKYLWKDPVTATLWMLPGAAMPYTKNVTCADPYREPTIAEAALAAQRGLKLAANTLGAPMLIWTSQPDGALGEYAYNMAASPMRSDSTYKTALGGAYCVHQ